MAVSLLTVGLETAFPPESLHCTYTRKEGKGGTVYILILCFIRRILVVSAVCLCVSLYRGVYACVCVHMGRTCLCVCDMCMYRK